MTKRVLVFVAGNSFKLLFAWSLAVGGYMGLWGDVGYWKITGLLALALVGTWLCMQPLFWCLNRWGHIRLW
jgi:hypothetical protein